MKIKGGQVIVFAGDSVTDAGRKRPIGEGLWEGVGNGYVRQIDNLLSACYPEEIFSIINMGESGNTSRDLLARFDGIIALKPDVVVILIGFNDVWRFFDEPAVTRGQVGKEEFGSNVRSMINKCRANGAEVVLMTPYYLEANEKDPMRKKMDEYRAEITALGIENGLPVIDLQKRFDEYMKVRYPSFITWDRIHPGHVGGTIIADEFLKFAEFDFDRLK